MERKRNDFLITTTTTKIIIIFPNEANQFIVSSTQRKYDSEASDTVHLVKPTTIDVDFKITAIQHAPNTIHHTFMRVTTTLYIHFERREEKSKNINQSVLWEHGTWNMAYGNKTTDRFTVP